MVQNTLPPDDSSHNPALEQAIRLIGDGQYAKAKEILTSLLQTDQNNATYWVWMSATMETQKERLYCLQMAYKMDPTNAAAQRGLVLLGALSPDETTIPFPMNHARPWESRLRLAEEKDRPTGIRRVTSNPLFRLAAIGTVAVILLGAAIFGVGAFINRRARPVNLTPNTPRPTVSPLPKKGPTLNATLAPLLNGPTYTPTPIYAMTPHEDIALDAYHIALRDYSQGNWGQMADMMLQIATSQPGSVDALYFAGEGKRLSGQYKDALEYYKKAIKVNPKFAPIYLGMARANLSINPLKSEIADFNQAIKLDPNYTEAYLARGLYLLDRQDMVGAEKDLKQAASMNPDSPLIQSSLARFFLATGENEAALTAARKAKELDVTASDSYLLLGMAARANDQPDEAIEALDIYTRYFSKTNDDAFTTLGAAYVERAEYESALTNIEQAITLNSKNSEAYYWRGEIYLATKDYTKALSDFRQSNRIHITFEASIGIAKTILANTESESDAKKARDAYSEAYFTTNQAQNLTRTDKQKGILFYYQATVLEKLNEQTAASRAWANLLALPEGATTEDQRANANARIIALQSATPPPPTSPVTDTPQVTMTPGLTPTP
jgi:tetratricopeptide (TPR) repeat protein